MDNNPTANMASAEAQEAGKQPAQPVMTGVRKRQQIKNTNKQIFLWLAVASVIVSICLVALQFLVRDLIYNQDIINKKSETNKTLEKNIQEAAQLQKNVNQLLADPNLSALKYEAQNKRTSSLSVILDALPVKGDATAFSNSLQSVILPRSGVAIKELNTVNTEEMTSEETSVSGPSEPTPLPFTVSYNGNYGQIQQSLLDLSHVIRPINLTELSLKAGEKGILQTTITGVTYYQPAKTVDVRKEVLKP